MTSNETKLVGALTSGLQVIRYLGRQHQPVGVTRIARDLQLNPSTCFNLLRTLVHEEIAVFDPATKTYGLGLGIIELTRGALERVSRLRLIRPQLERIAATYSVTTTLWHRTGPDRVVLVDYAESRSAIRLHMSVGQRLPWTIAALGRCLAAHSGLTREELESEFRKLRWQNPLGFDQYEKEVEEAGRKGFAIDQERYVKGVTTVSAPILVGDRAVMAISSVGFTAQHSAPVLRKLAHDLRDTARDISSALSASADAVGVARWPEAGSSAGSGPLPRRSAGP